MKTLTRVAFYALLLSSVSISTLHAQEQAFDAISNPTSITPEEEAVLDVEVDENRTLTLIEAQRLIQEMPGAKDAITGPIDVETSQKIYDIYGRQLAYREGAKKYRASLEERRKNFAAPRTRMIERYVDVQDQVRKAETAAYQQEIEKSQDSQGEEEDVALEIVSGGESLGFEEKDTLKEQMISEDPFEDDEGQMVQKKVVTSDDAPEFDPVKLDEEYAPVLNFEEEAALVAPVQEGEEVLGEVLGEVVVEEEMIVVPSPEFAPSISVPPAPEAPMEEAVEAPAALVPTPEAPAEEAPSILVPTPEAPAEEAPSILVPTPAAPEPEAMDNSIKLDDVLDGGPAFPPRLAEDNPFADDGEVPPPPLEAPAIEPLFLEPSEVRN